MSDQKLMLELAKSLESTGRLAEKLTAELDRIGAEARAARADGAVVAATVAKLERIIQGDGTRTEGLQSIVASMHTAFKALEKRERERERRFKLATKIAGGVLGSGGTLAAAYKIMSEILK